MSKSDKTMFYYLGLTLLLLIVLGILFGISSVKESFGRRGGNKANNCRKEGVILAKDLANRSMGHPDERRRVNWKDEATSIVNEIKEKCADAKKDYTMSESKEKGREYGLNAIKTRSGW